jgi:hypothetical protein
MNPILRFFWSELRKPYGFAGIVMALGALLFLGGVLYKVGEWLAKAAGWV